MVSWRSASSWLLRACAERRPWWQTGQPPTEVAPGVCGEAIERALPMVRRAGCSGRVRRGASFRNLYGLCFRLLRACAERRRSTSTCTRPNEVAPGVCGEALDCMRPMEVDLGCSGRVRRGVKIASLRRHLERLLRACAERRYYPGIEPHTPQVAPGVCGEAFISLVVAVLGEGCSGRVRRGVIRWPFQAACKGLLRTHVERRAFKVALSDEAEVAPGACGEAELAPPEARASCGCSGRVRRGGSLASLSTS